MVRQISAEAPNMTPREQRLLALAKKQLTGAAPSVEGAPTLDQEIKRLQQLQKAHDESANRSGHHPGVVGYAVIAGLQALSSKQAGKPLRWNIHGENHEIPDSKLQGLSPRQVSALIYTKVSGYKPGPGQAFGNWFAVPATGKAQAAAKPSVLTNPSREAPGQAPKPKQQGLTTQDVTNSSQQAAFARQQQQAARAAGDERGAQAWRQEERTVERNRLANAIATRNQSQTSLFGETEHDQSLPLFQEQASTTGQSQPRAQQRTVGSPLVPSGRSAPAVTPEVVNAEVLPARPDAGRPGSIASTMREALNAMKAADARQMGLMAEQLFETDWLLERKGRYRGMSKDQAREQYKVQFMQKLQEAARSPEAAARREAMGRRAAESGSISGAMRSLLEDMKASDDRLNDLTRQAIDLRVGAEEQFGGEAGEDPTLGGGRPRRRLGGSKRRDGVADSLEGRISALRMHFAPLSR
jgi:hypothetical protein